MCLGGNMLRTLITPGTLIGDRLGIPNPLDAILPKQQNTQDVARQKAAAAIKPVRPATLLNFN